MNIYDIGDQHSFPQIHFYPEFVLKTKIHSLIEFQYIFTLFVNEEINFTNQTSFLFKICHIISIS